jgi:hypothetical protein
MWKDAVVASFKVATIPAFTWKERGNSQKTPIRLAGLCDEI